MTNMKFFFLAAIVTVSYATVLNRLAGEAECSATKHCEDYHDCIEGKCKGWEAPSKLMRSEPECSATKHCEDYYDCDNGVCKGWEAPSKVLNDVGPQ